MLRLRDDGGPGRLAEARSTPGAYDAAFDRAFEAVQAHLEILPAARRRPLVETGSLSVRDLAGYPR
jgi:hypothetical protein